MVTLKHRWDVDTFSSAVPYQSPTHLVCNEKHLCTNLFVTIHWRDDLSSCHALVAAWCLKNMASQKFQTARLAGHSWGALASDYGNKAGGRRQKSTAISTKNKYDDNTSMIEMTGERNRRLMSPGKRRLFQWNVNVRCSQRNLFFRKNGKILLSDDKLLKNGIKVAWWDDTHCKWTWIFQALSVLKCYFDTLSLLGSPGQPLVTQIANWPITW